MKELFIDGIPYIIAAAFLSIGVALKPHVKNVLNALEEKTQQILGKNVFDEAKAFAIDEIKSLLQKYPESTLEDIASKGIVFLENKYLHLNILSKEDIETIISATIHDIEENLKATIPTLSSSYVSTAQQKFLAGTITAEQRKDYVVNGITASLKDSHLNITDDLKNKIDDSIECKVLDLKTPEDQKKAENNVLQSQVDELNSKVTNLVSENTSLKSNLEKFQSAFSTLKSDSTEKKEDIKPVIEESKTVTK
jgi:FtsZ-binding cell division protein ZapB